jgi:hypothetical protein
MPVRITVVRGFARFSRICTKLALLTVSLAILLLLLLCLSQASASQPQFLRSFCYASG